MNCVRKGADLTVDLDVFLNDPVARLGDVYCHRDSGTLPVADSHVSDHARESPPSKARDSVHGVDFVIAHINHGFLKSFEKQGSTDAV